MFYTLEYKLIDSKGRERNTSYVGVYKDLEKLNQQKENIIKFNPNQSFSFQVYTHERFFP
jgi:hypothetical protein